jgi:hypothetical protein
MTEVYIRPKGVVGFIKERAFRTLVSTLDAPATTIYPVDKKLDDGLALARTLLFLDTFSTIGSGTRTPDYDFEGAYEIAEDNLEFALQTARTLYGVLGGCVTTGTDTGETGTVTSGGGTATLLLSGGGAFTINEFAGMMLTITSGDNSGNKYHIVSNDADEVTLDVTTPANIDADGYRIDGPPFTHTISETNALPSFALHEELENDTDAQSIRFDTLGTIFNTVTVSLDSSDPGNFATQTVDILSAKTIPGNDIARPTELDDNRIHTFCHVVTNTLMYNSVNYIDLNNTIELEITNNAEMEHTQGDCYATHATPKERETTLTLGIKPFSKVLWELRNTKISNYLTNLVYTFKVSMVGGSHTTAITDTILSVSGNVITLTTGGLTVDAHIGEWIVVTSGDNIGWEGYITDNDASTITVSKTPPINLASDGVEIKYPFDIQITLDKLKVTEAEGEIPSKDDMEFAVDFQFMIAGGGTVAIVSKDDLGPAYYEGSS